MSATDICILLHETIKTIHVYRMRHKDQISYDMEEAYCMAILMAIKKFLPEAIKESPCPRDGARLTREIIRDELDLAWMLREAPDLSIADILHRLNSRYTKTSRP